MESHMTDEDLLRAAERAIGRLAWVFGVSGLPGDLARAAERTRSEQVRERYRVAAEAAVIRYRIQRRLDQVEG